MKNLIQIDVYRQTLSYFESSDIVFQAAVSTAKNGLNEKNGSEGTPRGKHYIRAKIGKDAAINSVFVGRRQTGELYSPELARQYQQRDWILTRILWLCGLEPGKNRMGDVDTMRRYIYLHGSPDSASMGKPESHGCIRMRNADIVTLFDKVDVGTHVYIS